MKKLLLWSTMILGCLTLAGCSDSTSDQSSHQKNEQSESSSKDYMAEATKNIEHKSFYQAKENLELAKKEEKDDTKINATLHQIDNYQKAEDAMSNKKYEDASQYARQVENEKEGLPEMQDYAVALGKEISDKQKSEKKEEPKHQKKTKEVSHKKEKSAKKVENSSLYTGDHLSNDDKETINKEMESWCKSQAAKGGMSIMSGTFFPHGAWSSEETKVTASTPDGKILLFDGQGVPNNTAWNPTSGDINAVGGALFYVKGTKSNGGIVGPNYPTDNEYAKVGTQVDYYLWADNGKVYELKETVTRDGGEGCGYYNVNISDSSMNHNDAPTYQISEDKAAIEMYQSLLKKYGGSQESDHNTTSSHSSNDGKWNSNKEDELANFMNEWANEMGQSYEEGEISTSPDSFGGAGLGFVHQSDYKQACGYAIPYNQSGQPLNFTCSEHPAAGQYQVVAYYGPRTEDARTTKEKHYYAFTIKDGEPIVLNGDDQDSKGNIIFKPTSNQALQNGFAKIVEN